MSLNFIKKDKVFFNSVFFVVALFFLSVFLISLFKIINIWTYSQAHINYFFGFVQRGLFGTLMIFAKNYLSINSHYFFSTFFIIIYSLNILFFFKLIKKYHSNKLLLSFIAFCPTLIMFSFNDLGGYQRFDSISILLILVHSLICYDFYSNNITKDVYKKKLLYLIFPLIIVSLFIHEIQSWSIFFHFLISYRILKSDKKFILFFSFIFLIVLIIFLFPFNENSIYLMKKDLETYKNVYQAALVGSNTQDSINILKYEFQTNFLNFYNFKINIFFTILGTAPFYLLLLYFRKKKIIQTNFQSIDFFISIIPFFSYFFIGDTGRWINIMSFIAIGYLGQFPLNEIEYKKFNKNFFKKKVLVFFFIFIVILTSFFLRMPHCCNLQKKGIGIHGGVYKKIEAAINIFIFRNNDDFYNLNKRFNSN